MAFQSVDYERTWWRLLWTYLVKVIVPGEGKVIVPGEGYSRLSNLLIMSVPGEGYYERTWWRLFQTFQSFDYERTWWRLLYPVKVIMSVPGEGYSRLSNLLIMSVPSEGYCTWWRLFQKFDIYVCIKPYIQPTALINQEGNPDESKPRN